MHTDETSIGADSNRLFIMEAQDTVILGKKYSHFNLSESMLDSTFVKQAKAVEDRYRKVLNSRQDRLRVEEWLSKLASYLCLEKLPLLKNRNSYMKQLHRCIMELGALEGVFKKMPPAGTDLENL